MHPSLVLASTSPYRRELLGRLRVPFETDAPNVEETPSHAEPGRALAVRLARAKAEAVAGRHPHAWVLASDQVAVRGDEVLGKPGSVEACEAQLVASSGREVAFLTAVCVLRGRDGRRFEHVDETRVVFRSLRRDEVRRYVALERPLDCAGGFKSEGLGIALFERIESEDPTALVGLPLIWVARTLRTVGMDPLDGERRAVSGER